jgi:hypothetical protein
VWDGGKDGDNIKILPIVIPDEYDVDRVHPKRHEACPQKGQLNYSRQSEYRGFPDSEHP